MAISWTKEWAASDDGTIITAADLKNIQDDVSSGLTQDAESIQGNSIAAPGAVDDDKFIQYDYANSRFIYVTVTMSSGLTGIVPVAKGGTGSDLSSAAEGTLFVMGSDGTLAALGQGTAGQVLISAGADTDPTWEDETYNVYEAGTRDLVVFSTGSYVGSTGTWFAIGAATMARDGTVTTKVTANASGSGSKLRVYLNGSPEGTERSLTPSPQTWSENIAVAAGDSLAFYVYLVPGATTVTATEMKFTVGIPEVATTTTDLLS